MKKIFFLSILLGVLFACAPSDKKIADANTPTVAPKKVDDGKGIGETKTVALNNPLNEDMVASGKGIYEMKCAACHKLTDKRVVGPGWAGVTSKRKPEWIMNMTTNVEVMLAEDPEALALLKECLVRMPNQNLTVADARNVLEFMYKNDEK